MIKNNGGIFGRNPTFSNVDVEGDLTVDGSITGTVVAAAGTLTGATLAANVLASSLTSVGTLSALTVNGTVTLGNSALISSPSATALAIQSAVPAGTGVMPTIQIICPNSAFTLLNSIATQSIFSPAYDTVNVQALTTYMVDGQYLLQTGTASHSTSISFPFAGGINIPQFYFTTIAWKQTGVALTAPTRSQDTNFFTAITGGVVATAGAFTHTLIKFEGIMRTDDAGTIVPKVTFGAVPGVTNYCLAGSYLRFYPIGSNTINSVGTAIV